MSVHQKIGVIVVFFISCLHTYAQDYLQFIENKGQWDKQIRYKGEMTNGAFALQATGYRVLLHNKSDLSLIGASLHPNDSITQPSSTTTYYKGIGAQSVAGDSLTTRSSSGPIVLHSHAYEVRFLNANQNPVIVPDKPLDTYTNYFIGNDSTKWASHCKTYQAITYK